IFVVNNGSDWHFQHNALAVATGAVGAFSVTSTLGLVFRIEAEMHQRVMALTGFHDHVASAAAVAAGGAAARDKLLPPKRHAAVAAVTGFDPDYCFVNKHAYLLIVQANAGFPFRDGPTQPANVLSLLQCRHATLHLLR